jgi:hypothetical protein
MYCAYASKPKVSAAGRNGKKTLTVISAKQNLGKMWQGTEREAVFRLRNDDSEPVRIEAIQPGCTCTRVDLAKMQISPGETVDLVVHVSAENRRGILVAMITLKYSTPGGETESQYAEVQAEVVPDVFIEPQRLTIDRQTKRAEVLLVPNPEGNARIISVATDHNALRAQLTEDARKVIVLFDPEVAGNEPIRAQLLVSTTSKHEPIIRIPLEVLRKF